MSKATLLVIISIFIGSFLGIVIAVTPFEQVSEEPVVEIAVKQESPYKKSILQWMLDVSNEPSSILEEIYNTIEGDPLQDLLLAIMYNETHPKFNIRSKSKTGAVCLMQIAPVWIDTLKKEGIIKERRDLWLIPNCVKAGRYILITYLQKEKSIRKALLRYSGGSRKYADKIIKTLGDIYLLKTEQKWKKGVATNGRIKTK